MTQLYPLEPRLVDFLVGGAKLDRLQLSTTEVFTDPIALAVAGDTDAASLLEIFGTLVGAKLGGTDDVTVNFYRCPSNSGGSVPPAENRATEPYATATLDVSDVAAAGTTVVINGGFGADTNWTKGDGWTIAAGVATHAATASHSSLDSAAAVAVTDEAWYMVEVDITTLAVSPLRILLDDVIVAEFTETGTKQIVMFQAAAGAATRTIKILADASAVIDNLALQLVVPYRFCAVKRSDLNDGAGSGFVMGILPAADYAGCYLSAKYRRIIT